MTRESQSDSAEVPERPSSKPPGGVALTAGMWILIGLGVMQVLRLASNVVLTRLLYAEAFGMMQLVYAFMVGLHLFTDGGIGPSDPPQRVTCSSNSQPSPHATSQG